MIEWKGAAVRLKPADFSACLALMPKVEEAALRAVIETETAGSGYDKAGRPSALFERHLFYAALGPGKARDKAVALGLAYPKWGTKPYPKSSDGVYAEIIAACAIDENAALSSTSWGLGQILGREHKEAGFADARTMVLAFRETESSQLQAMVALIVARGLDKALRTHAWATFARGYNGAGYAKNHYDTKLAASYARWVKRLGAGDAGATPIGDLSILQVQEMLTRLGFYEGAIDGISGPITQAAIREFQDKHPPLQVDGVAGPRTKLALADALRIPTG